MTEDEEAYLLSTVVQDIASLSSQVNELINEASYVYTTLIISLVIRDQTSRYFL